MPVVPQVHRGRAGRFGIHAASGKAEVLHGSDASQDLIVQAARSCPYRAITVVDETLGVQLFPPLRKQSPVQD